MEPIQIRAFDKPLDIRLSGDSVSLPPALRTKADAYWRELLVQKPKLFNGEVFTVRSVEENASAIHILLDETDYAHYLYGQHAKDLGEYTVRNIHPAALVVSSDDKLIFGTMGPHTSLSGTIQCCGGGIDRQAVKEDGTVSVDTTMLTELSEELGITADDRRVASITPKHLKFGGPTGKMTVVYIVKLTVTAELFMVDYSRFVDTLKARGEDPEFSELFSIARNPKIITAFIEEHADRLSEYMPILLNTVADPATAI